MNVLRNVFHDTRLSSKPLDQRLNVILHDLREPERLLAAHCAKTGIVGSKDPILRSLVLAQPIPGQQILRRVFIDRNRLGRGFGLALARPLVDDGANNVDEKSRMRAQIPSARNARPRRFSDGFG